MSLNKKDPAVVEHVSNEVNKAVAKAVKAETTRCLAVVKNHAEAGKAIEDKGHRTAVTNAHKAVIASIKSPIGA